MARLIRLASAARTLARCRPAYALQPLGQQRPSMRWPQKPAVVQAADDLSVHPRPPESQGEASYALNCRGGHSAVALRPPLGLRRLRSRQRDFLS